MEHHSTSEALHWTPGIQSREAQGAYTQKGTGMDTANKAEGDRCYDKGEQKMCVEKEQKTWIVTEAFEEGFRGRSILLDLKG